MSDSIRTKGVSRKAQAPAQKKRSGAAHGQSLQPAQGRTDDAQAIERAVYDGMQDLRAEKSK